MPGRSGSAESGGLGIPAALIAEIARQVRLAGGELLHGGADVPDIAKLYQRVAIGNAGMSCYVSAEAFQALADLAALPPRDIVRQLPNPTLNGEPPRPR